VKKLFLFLSKAKETHQQAMNEAMDRYKSTKQSRLKKLVKITRRGQSVTKRQIQLLLEKI
jgi:hemerythrin superfamily protein